MAVQNKREGYRNCSILCSVLQLIYVHTLAVLTVYSCFITTCSWFDCRFKFVYFFLFYLRFSFFVFFCVVVVQSVAGEDLSAE